MTMADPCDLCTDQRDDHGRKCSPECEHHPWHREYKQGYLDKLRPPGMSNPIHLKPPGGGLKWLYTTHYPATLHWSRSKKMISTTCSGPHADTTKGKKKPCIESLKSTGTQGGPPNDLLRNTNRMPQLRNLENSMESHVCSLVLWGVRLHFHSWWADIRL